MGNSPPAFDCTRNLLRETSAPFLAKLMRITHFTRLGAHFKSIYFLGGEMSHAPHCPCWCCCQKWKRLEPPSPTHWPTTRDRCLPSCMGGVKFSAMLLGKQHKACHGSSHPSLQLPRQLLCLLPCVKVRGQEPEGNQSMEIIVLLPTFFL